MKDLIAKKDASKTQSILEHGEKAFEEYIKIRNFEVENGLIKKVFESKLIDKNKEFVLNLIGESVKYHDYGKSNVNFQYKIGGSLVRTVNFNSRHSVLSAKMFIEDKINELYSKDMDDINKILTINYISILAFAISMHHIKYIKDVENRFYEFCAIMNKYIELDLIKSNTYYSINILEIFQYSWKIIKIADVSASIKFKEECDNEGLGDNNKGICT